ncbi:unnamed protein product [Coffea canephora]|uniref:WAT1-related protein n=1 Tax=Coffea canephora TaxID=49390 RepID=A0A068UX05_COFCA|nr:unnamed protein product [Coffea canephora]
MEGKKPYLAVVIIHILYTGMFSLSKDALNGAPITFFLEWKTAPSLSLMTFIKIFMPFLFGGEGRNVNALALKYTSASLAAVATNTLPVITFFLALLFSVKLQTIPGIVKVAGVAICFGGAATVAFFKGLYLRLLGVFLMLLSNVFWSIWLIFPGLILKSYPSKLLCTALQCFLSTIQSFIIAIALVRDPNEWKLGWSVRLISVAYSGIVVAGVTFYLQAWVIEKKGPVFLAVTPPRLLVFTMCTQRSSCQNLHYSGVRGGFLRVVGLYYVLKVKGGNQGKGGLGFRFPKKNHTPQKRMKPTGVHPNQLLAESER